jgi:pyridoxal phosphate enzyme (YggS family)
MSIKSNLDSICSSLPLNTTLVAVSKTKPTSTILEAYEAGHRDFGENRIQEMTEKYKELPKDIKWHMIGHLQTNKIKYMASFVYLIHGVDRFKVLKEINRQAKLYRRTINCLLQLRIASEETKFGMAIEEAEAIIHSESFHSLENIKIIGLMGMASFTSNKGQINQEFGTLKNYFERLKNHTSKNFELKELSMGMSGDYPLAIENGSTMVRVGSAIFGNRNY